jgi:hypothetical protein
MDNRGRLVVFSELTSQDMGIEQFATSALRPAIFKDYIGKSLFMVADPSGQSKGQVGEESPFDCLKRLGFHVYPAPTNDVDPRIRAVEQFLLRQTDGGPLLIIYEEGCPLLCQAMKYWYRYRRKTTGVLDDTPEKNHPWSDLADCLQYMALCSNVGYIGRVMQRLKPPPTRTAPSPRAWT